ncbi:hypothetical protein [Nocardioides dilutus]
MSEVLAVRPPVPSAVRAADIGGKAGLLLLLLLAIVHPESGHLQDKAAGLRAVGYPLASLTVPIVWWVFWKDRVAFPWLADLLVTITCFTDVLGNRMDLYDSVVWFDDWMHFMNTSLLVSALLLLTTERSASRLRLLERGLAFGATAAIAWELAEYAAFISSSSEKRFAYEDTLGDLFLGTLGAVVAALALHGARRRPAEARWS